MSREETISLLAPLALFEDCSRRELARVADVAVEATFAPGTTLTREDQEGGLLFVVVDGTAAVLRGGQQIGTLGRGEVFGELSLIDGHPRSATVKALTPLRVLQVTRDDFHALMDKTPHLAHNVLASLARRIRETDARVY